ncbi:PREDICTED: uncharacterized protein LOC106815053 [Priapulus caudatus]|uniref:Uncharacterized protein LOC106815053 n=1 Tax=Priapulus caudatus TaxID=37621 RepID=A0ABM1ERZ5_PRICU|nr:PREDICTED: uncharacterized protein LOC106815053 [Priapulus caudatus]
MKKVVVCLILMSLFTSGFCRPTGIIQTLLHWKNHVKEAIHDVKHSIKEAIFGVDHEENAHTLSLSNGEKLKEALREGGASIAEFLEEAEDVGETLLTSVLARFKDGGQLEALKETAQKWKDIAKEKLSELGNLTADQLEEWRAAASDKLKEWTEDAGPQFKDWKMKLERLGIVADESVMELRGLIDEAIENWEAMKVTIGTNSCTDVSYNHNIQICCNGNVYSKFGFITIHACCREYLYDIFSQQCCYGQVLKENEECNEPTELSDRKAQFEQ